MMHSKDVTGLVKQILTELPRLQIESHQKLSVLTETGEVVYQCRLSECAFQCKTIDKLEVSKYLDLRTRELIILSASPE